MNELNSVLRHTTVLVFARLLERGNTFVLVFLVSRMLGPSELGIYATAMVYYGILSSGTELGARPFLLREIARCPSWASRYTVHLLYLATCASLIAILATFCGIPLLGYSDDVRLAIFVAVLAILPATLSAIQEAVFIAYQRVEFQTYTALATALAQSGISIYLLVQGYGVISLLVTFVAVKYGVTVAVFFLTRQFVRLSWHLDLDFVRQIVRELRSFAGLSIMSALCSRPELLIISLVASEAVVGLYSGAIKLVEFWYLVPEAFMLNVFPILSRTYAAKSAQVRSWIQDTSIKYLLALSLPLAVGITFASHPILEFLYGEEFVRATPILQWAAWTLPLTCLVEVFWRILAARNEQHTLLQVQIVSTLLRVAVAYGLTVSFGAPGAALAAVVSLTVHTALLLNRVRRDGTAIHPCRLAWRFGVGALAMGIVIMMTVHQVHLWMVAVIAAATYAAFSIFTRAISGQDLIVVRQMMLAARKP